jgi:hypothetical protein
MIVPVIKIGLLAAAIALPGIAQAAPAQLSQASLAGHFAGRAIGFVTFCFDSNNASANCGTAGSVPVQFNATLILAETFDRNGNACGNFTISLAPVAASAAPARVLQEANVVTITSFDSTTNTAEADFHNFIGGKCNGAAFDNTGAIAFSQGTLHIAIINNGNQLESMVKTDAATDGSIGSEILGWTSTRQVPVRR